MWKNLPKIPSNIPSRWCMLVSWRPLPDKITNINFIIKTFNFTIISTLYLKDNMHKMIGMIAEWGYCGKMLLLRYRLKYQWPSAFEPSACIHLRKEISTELFRLKVLLGSWKNQYFTSTTESSFRSLYFTHLSLQLLTWKYVNIHVESVRCQWFQ